MNVFDRLTRLFSGPPAPEPKPLPPTDIPHALGALLVRVAKIDDHYAVQEISQIDKILARFENIGPVDAAKMRADCERLEEHAPATQDFADLLRTHVDYDARLAMTEALWNVVYADGRAHQSEESVMDLTRGHLGISPEDCEMARNKALS